ncbi:MAG TPA: polysaccharide deacetylase family protein [Bacillota bacterium]|nr:polysaccharide deacetylase family protein [Bacillota bacterium]
MSNRKGFVRYIILLTKMLSILLVISISFVIDIPMAIQSFNTTPDKTDSSDVDKTDEDSSTLPIIGDLPDETPEVKEPVVVGPPTQTPDPEGAVVEPPLTQIPDDPNDPDDPVQDQEPDNDPGINPDGDKDTDPEEDEDLEEPAGEQEETNKYYQAAMEAISQRELNNLYGHNEDKVAYLTFDDGPTKAFTHAILNILAQEDVKATFFLIGTQVEQYPEIVRRQYEEGHGIGNHTYTHIFKDIYKSPATYTKGLRRMEKVLQSTLDTDKKFRLTRFPGGSFGGDLAGFRKDINKKGFVHIDWNCVNGDAESLEISRPEDLVERVKETANNQTSLIVLMHDSLGKQTTVEALPEIISFLRQEGYRFELLPASRGY